MAVTITGGDTNSISITGGNANLNVGAVSASSPITLTSSPFIRTSPTITSDYTVTSQFNELSVGPVTINTGVTVTILTGATWVVV